MLNVACVKWGSLYGPEYVNTLFDMVRRNLRAGFPGKFVCFTDDPTGLEEGIEVRPLPGGLTGWWNKLYLFSDQAFPKGERVLYFDLDTVITGPLDELADYYPGLDFAILRDAYRPDGLQSSVMAWTAGIPDFWVKWHQKGCPLDVRGDQGFIEDYLGSNAKLFQELFPKRFRSYKVDCRDHIPVGTNVVFFHGHPRPHEVTYGWVPQVWKVGGGSAAELVMCTNVDPETQALHVSCAIALDGPWLELAQDSRSAVIVGGGPSLADNLHYIRGLQMSGAVVYATGNAFDYLCHNGIRADAHVLLDARPENIEFVHMGDGVPKLYASQCHPAVLAAAGQDLQCWHAAMTSYEGLVQDHKGLKIGGGTTVGLKAIAIAFARGHRQIYLMGFDSSYGESHHAYPQALNDSEKTLDYSVGGRTFKCAPWMITQAEDFKNHLPLYLNSGCVIRIFGEGLIPHLASVLGSPEIQIDGIWWPAGDVHARPAILETIGDLKEYINLCTHHRVAVQAGGNVGVWAKELAKHFDHVITFEPDPLNWKCLDRNVTELNIYGVNAALGDEFRKVGVQSDLENCGASCINGSGDIQLVTLDEMNLDHCDLLQLDVEGYELKALKGAEATLRRCSPLIVLELKGLGDKYGDSDAATIEWLAERGYQSVGAAHRDIIFKRICS